MKFLRDFKNINKSDVSLAGGKGASLGEMTQVGISIPPGFVILATAFDQFLEETDLNVEIAAVLDLVNHNEMHTIENASEKIQALILQAEMPKDIKQEIKIFFKNLNVTYVAVRSSATAEDSASAAWAGQLESYLNTTEENLLENVKKCWASLFTPRAIFYRFEKELHKQKISVAVVVQKMVESEKSGVAFSVHPVTRDQNQLIIEAGFGLGEAIVSRGLYRARHGGNEWLDIPKEQGEQQVLSDSEILELSEIILQIEDHYSFPCDIEWAFEKEEFYITQSRPITTLVQDDTKIYHNFQKFLSRKHSTLTDSILVSAWNDKDRFKRLTEINEYVKNIEIIDGDFCFDVNWTNEIIEKYTNIDERFFWEFINKGYKHGEIFKDFCRAIEIEGKDTQKLQKIFHQSVELMKNLLVFLPETHPLAKIVENKVNDILIQKGVSRDDLNNILIAISSPLKLNSPALEVEELRKIKTNKDAHSHFDVSKAIDDHYQKYAFLGYREPFSSGYTKEFFIQCLTELDEQNKNNQNTIQGTTFSDSEQTWVNLLKEFVYFRNYRTEKLYEGLFYLEKLWDKLSDNYSLLTHSLGYYLLEEIDALFLQGEKVSDKIITERKKGYGFLLHDNEISLITGKELIYKKSSYTVTDRKAKEFTGMSACRGIIRGNAKIILRASEQDKIQDGDILVTKMTTPDFLPSMKRASAFITDEGGITCHAAIMAREMNKPCIIGTKIATQIILDGNLVEVDANKGIVKIL